MNSAFNFDNRYFKKYLKHYCSIFVFVLIIVILIFSLVGLKQDKGYLLFVEFNNAYGLKEGTNVNFRGVKIGYVSRISIHINKVIVLINIKKSNTMIPYNSIVEANQVGLFNDIVITIIPLQSTQYNVIKSSYILSKNCTSSSVICPNSYLKGYKGLNYDDLMRATTRISQRFDDPRFFNLFYLLLKNGINLSDELLFLLHNSYTLFFILLNLYF
uniref:Mce/MlaD domain-containing protein n=1 Tax=Dipterosiphonia australica TaxID=2007208 RepID=A0A1Z1ML17_9FLOR|nr:hypothetical protein [Dipterosiphonia australica]ARW66787.1 hypothetical protein [Dipterosiphonia australica]